MIEKMTLEQFMQIKNQLQQLIKKYEEDKNSDSEVLEQEINNQYFEIQNRLLTYDLSDIPFEAWEDFIILSDENHIADFSKTKANIDFELVEYWGNVNFRGCNVRNLEKIEYSINPKSFDEKVIKENPQVFLSDLFSEEFKEKYYSDALTITDLSTLSDEQIVEFKQKNYKGHIVYADRSIYLFELLDIDKIIQIYKHYSKEEYDAIKKLLDMIYYYGKEEYVNAIKNSDISNLKNACFYCVRDIITNSHHVILKEDYPKLFINENRDLFLLDANIPNEVKERYFNRSLTVKDLIDYSDVFQNMHLDYFMLYSSFIVNFIVDNYGVGKFQELVQKHSDVFKHIYEKDDFYIFSTCLKKEMDLETDFINAVKRYFSKTATSEEFIMIESGEAPEWLSSVNIKFIYKIYTLEELLMCEDDSVFVVDEGQRRVIDTLGIKNIIRFQKETGFFDHKDNEFSKDLEMFNAFSGYFGLYSPLSLAKSGIDFKSGSLTYEEFLTEFAKCLDNMRKNNIFTDYPDYDWIEGDFRNNHPEIFMALDAPEDLRKTFYKSKITPEFLHNNKDYIPYLIDKNLLNTIKAQMTLSIPGLKDEQGQIMPTILNFIEEYVSRYGNEKLLKLISKYGRMITIITVSSFHNEIENEKLIEQALRKAISSKIIKSGGNYSYLSEVPEMVLEYPELFVNFDNLTNIRENERQSLTKSFYEGFLSFEDIRKYPELSTILKDKNLLVAFGRKGLSYPRALELIKLIGNEKILKLCSVYGRYMDEIFNSAFVKKNYSEKDLELHSISRLLESAIIDKCLRGDLLYYPEDAPSFLRETHPELFLSDDAPEELKSCFYMRPISPGTIPFEPFEPLPKFTFSILQQHEEWLPFLKGKSIKVALIKNSNYVDDIIRFFDIFGEEKAIKLGIKRASAVEEMIKSHQVDLMKRWYDKTGGKFIPDFVVMQNFSIDEADKFLASGSNWSNLMRIKSFSKTPEARDAMLKLAYSFGAFDQDSRGFKKLQELLTDLPRNISPNCGYMIGMLSQIEKQFSGRRLNNVWLSLGPTLEKEGVNIDFNKEIFSQIYRENEDGSYTLTINPQNYPESSQLIRNILEINPDFPILSPEKAHQLFGGFELKYDPDFREFLLANMDKLLENPEYISYVSSVQKQFSEIKAANSNRVLTWDLAISFVQVNKFTSVNVGNERVAEVAAIAGYSQSDFDTLQKIYNYGKQRTFSSIPRIEKSTEKTSGQYTYEILRLDDPLAMAIGTLSDCCQELNNCAEVCMEHSMVDKNGRVFVIKDQHSNIVAQSWVWRNKDVLCFDNIEIPQKAFLRFEKNHRDLSRKEFTDEVFEIYKKAALELIEEDEKIYRELLESGKITQEQYDGLRLGKITVGLGYNDIADSLKKNSVPDKGYISRPLPFEEPVKLSRGLYTSDSVSQYVLEEREDRKEFDGETLPVHNDDYIIYDDSNFNQRTLLTLEKLEIVTKENSNYLETSISDYANQEHLVTKLSKNYGLNPETTRIIMNPNFAIIYDINGNKLKIGDLLFNTRVDNGQQQMNIESKVIMQIKLALDQITSGKEIDISSLGEKQLAMYKKAISLTDEIDIERGVGHAR